MSARIL